MTARVLVVDDILANVKLLEARLTAEYFDVLTAMSGQEAIDICSRSQIDIILLDVMMPGLDGFETCRRLKADPDTVHIPVVMVTALDQPEDRIQGLEAGADDFLTKPVNDIALITRVKSLVRLKMLTDELRSRALAGHDIGMQPHTSFMLPDGENGNILLVDDRASSYERIHKHLKRLHNVVIETEPQEALFRTADENYDLVMISLGLRNFDGLRLCSQMRSLERTRHVPLLVISEPDDNQAITRALDIGVNDYLVRPIDTNEMYARVATQVRRTRYDKMLRNSLKQTMEMAVTDSLTGLNNRHYFETHANTLVDHATTRGRCLSILMTDIDHFKAVNDTYGHDVGDDVLREFANRLRHNVRGIDLTARLGGEEFVVIMPETDKDFACTIAERIRQCIADTPIPVAGGTRHINITTSIGVASVETPHDTPETLLKRADQALYAAKHDGRNRVVADAA
jgi:two-component system cell cycle response regulator